MIFMEKSSQMYNRNVKYYKIKVHLFQTHNNQYTHKTMFFITISTFKQKDTTGSRLSHYKIEVSFSAFSTSPPK